jgi:hypothetical protein
MKKIILFFVAIIFISCQEEKKVETDNTPISKVKDLANSFKTDKLQTFEFILKEDTLFTGKEGTKIFIPKDLFENYTNGKITFELKEFYTKEDIILNGLSTITDKDELLESSGMFYINFKEEGKQLNIKKGKNYNVEVANKPLSNSNIYYNDNDSIFRWKLSDEKMYVDIPDIVRNYKFGLMNGEGGYYKEVPIENLTKVKRQDSIELSRLMQEVNSVEIPIIIPENDEIEIFDENSKSKKVDKYEDIKNDKTLSNSQKKKKIKNREVFFKNSSFLYNFSSTKLGWINIDRLSKFESKKISISSAKFKENEFLICFNYLDLKSMTNNIILNFDGKFEKNLKVSGKIKAIIYTGNNEKIYYDSFYIDINSKPNFELNLKETTLEKLKQELVTP